MHTLRYLWQYRPRLTLSIRFVFPWRRALFDWRCRVKCRDCGRVFRLIEYPHYILGSATHNGKEISEGGIGVGVCPACCPADMKG